MDETIVRVKELLAQNIKTLRKQRGFSQEKLAEAAGLSTQTISDIEGCRTWVSDKTLENLAEALNAAVFQFFLPLGGDNGSNAQFSLYKRLTNLRMAMKNDIDNRLDRFFLSEKSFSSKDAP